MKGKNDVAAGEAKYNVVNIDGTILNRYFDYANTPREESYKQDVEDAAGSKQPADSFYRNIRAAAESGWDFSSRWFADQQHLNTIHTTDLIPVDLNCLLEHLEITIAKAYAENGDSANSNFYFEKAERRKNAILHYCWNDHLQCFCDYDFRKKEQVSQPTLAGMFPLFFQLATIEQAKEESKIIQHKFLKKGGVVTTLQNTGQQWDAPNGWAPLEFIAVEGLKNYNENVLAKKIADRWIHLNVRIFKSTGKLLEKYNVENVHLAGGGGEYPLQDGFGWTNGVLLKLTDEFRIKLKN